MRPKILADKDEDFDPEDKTLLKTEVYTDVQTEAIEHALKLAIAGTLQSGLKIIRVSYDEEQGREILSLQAEDAPATVVQSLTSQFEKADYDYELGTSQGNPDIIFVVAEVEE